MTAGRSLLLVGPKRSGRTLALREIGVVLGKQDGFYQLRVVAVDWNEELSNNPFGISGPAHETFPWETVQFL